MDNLVWHYTSLDVLEKIFLEKEPRMRATHFRDFSDTDEIVRGAKILLDELNGDSHFKETKYCQFLEALVSDKRYRDDFYVLSFCTQKDHFCQWLNYANKDGIGGCAIGFNPEFLSSLFVQVINAGEHGGECYTPEFNRLIECIYVDDDEMVEERVKKISKAYNWKNLPNSIKPFQQVGAFAEMFSNVVRIKRTTFSFENESRLLLRYYEPKLSKYTGQNPYPYLSDDNNALYCPFNKSHLQDACKEIMLAPNADKIQGEKLVEKINTTLGISLGLSYGCATGEKCSSCSRYATLVVKGCCNA